MCAVCVCVHVCVCVLDGEGSGMFAGRALVLLFIDGSVSDQLQWLSDQFLGTTFATLYQV